MSNLYIAKITLLNKYSLSKESEKVEMLMLIGKDEKKIEKNVREYLYDLCQYDSDDFKCEIKAFDLRYMVDDITDFDSDGYIVSKF